MTFALLFIIWPGKKRTNILVLLSIIPSIDVNNSELVPKLRGGIYA